MKIWAILKRALQSSDNSSEFASCPCSECKGQSSHPIVGMTRVDGIWCCSEKAADEIWWNRNHGF